MRASRESIGRERRRWGHWVVAVCALKMLIGCDPFSTQFEKEEKAVSYEARQKTSVKRPKTLTVMTYNVKFAGGRIDFFFDCHGERVLMNRNEVEFHLEGIASVIEELDPDIVFLQEVDVASKRAAYVDQVQWLLDHTSQNYGVYASHWKADFVPSDGLGPIDSGNAILSKFKLQKATRIALPLRGDQSGLEKYFYLKRNILIADVTLGQSVRLAATHVAAYSKDGTKGEQIQIFLDVLRAAPGMVIGAGDLNTLPPGSERQDGFEDSVCTDEDFQADDYSEEEAILGPFYDEFEAAIPLNDYQSDNSQYFTHTTDADGFWNRKLDYIFTNANVIDDSGVTHINQTPQGIETMPLSDHAPLTVEIELP